MKPIINKASENEFSGPAFSCLSFSAPPPLPKNACLRIAMRLTFNMYATNIVVGIIPILIFGVVM